MKPYISFITIAVSDLQRSLKFYRDGLGLATQGIVGQEFENGEVAFFEMQKGLTLALYPRKSLAQDAALPESPFSPTDLSLGHNANSEQEVDAIMANAERAGARIVKPAQPTFWGGYGGYFQDPDGHLWEIAFNPKQKVDY